MSDNNKNLNSSDRQEPRSITLDCIEVCQPIGIFYVASIPYNELIDISYVDTRKIEENENQDKDEIETLLGIQRTLNKTREKELRQYVNTYDACFPTAILLSIPERCAEYNPDDKKITIREYGDSNGTDNSVSFEEIASVLDGQHRIAGLKGYNGQQPFDVNISIFLELDSATEAYIFSVVNQAQTKVNKSLVYDLYSLATSRSPQRLCHQIAVTLNDVEKSPFKNKIKRLGSALPSNLKVSITQAAFVHALMKHISSPHSTAIKDRDLYMRGSKPKLPDEKTQRRMIFREMMIQERDTELTAILWNYFTAVRERWPEAWGSESEGIMLSKTNGFMALMRFLKDIYLHYNKVNQVITIAEFKRVFDKIDLEPGDFNTVTYLPGTSGESKLYQAFKEKSGVSA